MEPPSLPTHQQPPPGLPNQLIAHPGNHAAPYAPNSDERTLALVIHLLGLFSGFIGPLILWLIKKDESAYLNHHGKECLNFMITFTLFSILLMAAMFVLGAITLGIALIVLFPLYFAGIVAVYVLEIMACISANRGDWYRFPWTIRFIR